jgi:hypothetical protein
MASHLLLDDEAQDAGMSRVLGRVGSSPIVDTYFVARAPRVQAILGEIR